MEKIICKFCEKAYHKKGIKSHIWRAHTEEGQKHNPLADPEIKERVRKKNIGNPRLAWAKGLTKETDERIKKVSEAGKKKDNKGNFDRLPEETKQKIRDTMRNNRIGGYQKGSGRGKSGWYQGIWCDSSWELAFVVYHLENNIEIQRNKERFDYVFGGRRYKYIPDFIVNNEIIEIKGWWDEKNKEKIRQCPKTIKILERSEMKPYLDYVKQKYGSNFTELYEGE